MSLRRRLRSGDSIDTKAMAVASKHVPAADQSDNPLVMRQVFEAILPLNDLARSDYVEIARDAAAAYCSLSLADDSKPAFLATDALSSVLHLAKRSDPQIRENISEAIGRLCQHPLVKRPFVAAGLLDVLVGYSTTGSKAMAANAMFALMGLAVHDATRSDAQRFARLKPDQADKENITKAAGGFFVDFAFDMSKIVILSRFACCPSRLPKKYHYFSPSVERREGQARPQDAADGHHHAHGSARWGGELSHRASQRRAR